MNREERIKNLLKKKSYDIADLVEVVAFLRAPGGCPWDMEQTHASLRRDLIEETYEVIEAIDNDDPVLLREELGFEGVIMTDSLDMNAITLYTGDKASAVQAVISGNDLLCCTSYWAQIPAVLEAVREGLISEARIDESLSRVLRLKERFGII